MNALLLVGFVAFFLVACVVGIRLLLLWRRTRQHAELLMGIGVLGIGPVGFGFMMVGTLAKAPIAELAFGVGTIAVAVGVVAKCIFNWTVYRPDSYSARIVTIGVAALMLSILTLHIIDGRWIPTDAMAWDSLCRSLAQVGCLLWGSAESLYYWAQMRRRLKLGLADSVVVNRFLMWGIGAGFAGAGTGMGIVAEIMTGVPVMQIPWVVATSSAFGFAAAVAIYLAFIPPARYVHFIQGAALEADPGFEFD